MRHSGTVDRKSSLVMQMAMQPEPTMQASTGMPNGYRMRFVPPGLSRAIGLLLWAGTAHGILRHGMALPGWEQCSIRLIRDCLLNRLAISQTMAVVSY